MKWFPIRLQLILNLTLVLIILVTSTAMFFTVSFSKLTTNSKSLSTQTSGAIYHYSFLEKIQQSKESKIFRYYNNGSTFNKYYSFFENVREQLRAPASPQAIAKFDNIFDNRKTPWAWNNWPELETILGTKQLSAQVKLNINWNQLYRDVNIDNAHIQINDQELFRFYNIIAFVFGSRVVLQLVQNTKVDNNLTTFGKIDYYPNLIGQVARFSSIFANQLEIINQFNRQNISTRNPIMTTMHEYGLALTNYAYNDKEQRSRFNEKKIAFINQSNIEQQSTNLFTQRRQFGESSFHDIPQSLVWFLNSFSDITTQNDKVKKLFLVLMVVNSHSGNMAWQNNNVSNRSELFAEAFARWLGTTGTNRDYGWELLNDYFLSFFPRIYAL